MAKINNYTCAVASWLVFVFVINSKAYADLSSSLIPLVPVVDPTSNTTASSPLVASLLPVAVESVPPTSTPADSDESNEFDESNSSSAEIKDDMDVAEDIIFRPLFRYRQEVADRQQSRKYYQPYLLIIKIKLEKII
ncbi:Protein of unknown function [Cotesia congregata]|uniref:Uncharacterized protein n=1 Tax=Cotesia congregata TaxID=51543 RepID=A0A8J2HA73_COTCN|nr:Protein of unknown function [Cotesia congregata]